MPLSQAPQDEFEDEDEAKFRALAASRGVAIEYSRDRAAIDLGLHLSVRGIVTDTRVCFQFKGIHAETLGLGSEPVEVGVFGGGWVGNRKGHYDSQSGPAEEGIGCMGACIVRGPRGGASLHELSSVQRC
jgi:hypothetical protein